MPLSVESDAGPRDKLSPMTRSPAVFRATTTIRAQRREVWSVMKDVVRWPEWTPATVKSVVALDNKALMAGRRYRVKQPRLSTAVWKVTSVDANRDFTWQTRAPGLRLTATHELEGNGPTVVNLTLTIEGALARIAAWFARAKIEKYLRLEADALKRRVEGKRS